MSLPHLRRRFLLICLMLLVVSCTDSGDTTDATVERPTATPIVVPTESTAAVERPENFIVIAIDVPSRARIFTNVDAFGDIVGFDPDLIAALSQLEGFDYELVVTGYHGILDTVVDGEFDAAMGAIYIEQQPQTGIVYTDPYLEIGQVMVVRADNELASYEGLPAEATVGVIADSLSEATASNELNVPASQLTRYFDAVRLLEGLVDGEVDAVVMDHDEAAYYTAEYYQQLRLVGEGPAGWISSRAYGLAVAESNPELLTRLNSAIATANGNGTITTLTERWLTSTAPFEAGESLIGTLPGEVVIGVNTELTGLDPAEAQPSPLSWELKTNTMSGLFRFNGNNELESVMVDNYVIAEDGLQYTFTLTSGLTFPDGRPFTAEDVRWSFLRSSSQGNWLVNGYLKDSNDDGFADEDSVQTLGDLSLRIRLNEPTSYFFNLLATPPYFIVSQDCHPLVIDSSNICGGIGPYTIREYIPNEFIRLSANPDWPGTPPNLGSVQLRFYPDSLSMRTALENEQIDLIWSGLSATDGNNLLSQGFSRFSGPAIFKSYLVFEQSQPPWNDVRIRQAAALALDRSALASSVFGDQRLPLLSPVPDAVPGHLAAAPARDLDEARALLALAGYSEANPLTIDIWYLNDGRYTPLEADYAAVIKEQLEETGVFQVTLNGEGWGTFRPASSDCSYPAYLLGWPPSGSPPRIIDPIDWMDYFVTNTDTICSNYESEAMDLLLTELAEANPNPERPEDRLALYAQIQSLWAEEWPTVDLTQQVTFAFGSPTVTALNIDALGLLHYADIQKTADQ